MFQQSNLLYWSVANCKNGFLCPDIYIWHNFKKKVQYLLFFQSTSNIWNLFQFVFLSLACIKVWSIRILSCVAFYTFQKKNLVDIDLYKYIIINYENLMCLGKK